MKIVFALVVIALCYVQADLSPEQLEKLEGIMKECKETTEVTDEDVSLLLQHKLPESKAGKCFGACIKKKLGVLGDDNKVNMARVGELMEHLKEKDEEKYEKMMKVFETCAAEVPGGDDECEVAAKLSECCLREFKANDIKVDFMQLLHRS